MRMLLEIGKHCQEHISESSNATNLSELYIACQDGNVDAIRELLPTIPYHQTNRLECNGSTPLHIATIRGHSEIVRLLLHEYGCQRHFRDGDGLTAYDQAPTEEIRQLFYRPSNVNRFNTDEEPSPSGSSAVTSGNDVVLPKPDHQFLIGFEPNDNIPKQLNELNGIKTLIQSRFGRFMIGQGIKLGLAKESDDTGEEYAYVTSRKFREDALRKIIDEHVIPGKHDYKQCCLLLEEFTEHNTIESLLKLYTLETPFYTQLRILSSPLGFPFFMHLADLQKRYYQGYSYRGAGLTEHQLNEYRWAFQNTDRVLCIMTFSSTSIDRHVAEKFAMPRSNSANTFPTLFIYHFPQPCDTAINLMAIPEYHLPCLSHYENEREVLVAPRTLVKVNDIQFKQSNGQCVVYLESVSGEHQNIFKTLARFLEDDLKKKK